MFQLNSSVQVTRPLRLLSQPIRRFANAKKGIADGALFAFVKGTDPEVLLLLEAATPKDGAPAWRFAFARVSHLSHAATRRGSTAWSAPELSYAEKRDPGSPYLQLWRPPQPGE